MKTRLAKGILSAVAVLMLLAGAGSAAKAQDPLPSWNDGPAKQAIVAFVHATTDAASPDFVPPEQRIATFDNDGTLWVERPIPTQVAFALDRVKALASEHPEWATEDPFKAILADDREAMAKFTILDLEKVLAVTHAGMTVEAFQAVVEDWLATAKHPRFQRPYTELVYQPMLEAMRYLRANGYRTYIVSGGGIDFMRGFAEPVYGVPPEQVIGSAGQTRYGYNADGRPTLTKLPTLLLLDDKAGKPEFINLFIGRRPVVAFGNSVGDQQMLEWTQAGDGARLMMLVHHDDAEREYAYGPAGGLPDDKLDPFSDALMAEAESRGWIVISMKSDWNRIFP